jgi:hypothetical protein
VGKFKALWKKYGWVFVGTYATVWLTTLSTFYVLVDQGFMQTKGFDEDAVPNPLNPLEMLKKVRWMLARALPTQWTLVRSCRVEASSHHIQWDSRQGLAPSPMKLLLSPEVLTTHLPPPCLMRE